MIDGRPTVAFFASYGGGGFHRSHTPAATLEEAGWVVRSEPDEPRPGDWDVVVIHRPIDPRALRAVRRHQNAGSAVIVQDDDDLSRVPRLNDWTPEGDQEAIHDEAIRQADALVVTTPRLVEVYGPLARRTYLCRNALPEWLAQVRFYGGHPDPRPRIGWAGEIGSHRQDLRWLGPVANEAMDGCVFTTVGEGYRTPRALRWSGPVEAFAHQPVPRAFYQFMARADVGIVPLDLEEDRLFNTAKSSLKAQEYMALGVPVVVVDLPEQRRAVLGGSKPAGIVASSREEFAQAIRTLAWDLPVREEMAAGARVRGRELAAPSVLGAWEEAIVGAWSSRHGPVDLPPAGPRARVKIPVGHADHGRRGD